MRSSPWRWLLCLTALLLLLVGCGGGGSSGPTLKAFTGFTLNGVAGTVHETNKTISVTMPFGTDVRALVAEFDISGASAHIGAVRQVSGATANDFTLPVMYEVAGVDGKTASYRVTVAVASSSAKAMIAFALAGQNASINETYKAIGVVVPFGTDVTGLVATFANIGADVTVAGNVQRSGAAANDFTNPVTYAVLAADGSSVDYTVTVVVAQSSAKDISAFSLAGVVGTINEANRTIAVTMPFGTDPSALTAAFTASGPAVRVGATTQVSAATANDFTAPVRYFVSAADGTTAAYTVTVTVAPSPAKAITAYALAGVAGTIDESGKVIAVTMPFGSDVRALVAGFSTTGVAVAVGASPQISGTTANDFTGPIAYRVFAADGTMVDYTVTVIVALNPSKALTAFALAGVAGIIDEPNRRIAVTLPFGSSVTALVATFSTTGVGVRVGATPQASGLGSNDFTQPVVYTVVAANGSSADYTVTVHVAPSSAKSITAFSVGGATGVIGGANDTIAVTMPFGTSAGTLSSMVATFSTTGRGVHVAATAQISGTTVNDFSSPVTYRVTADDASTAEYRVTVAIAPMTAKAIVAFALGGVTGLVNEADKTISVPMLSSTDVSALVASFATTGAGVRVGAALQSTGSTANDFSSPVNYVVTAGDGSTAVYRVTVLSQAVSYQINPAHSGHIRFAGTLAFPANPSWSVDLGGRVSYPLIAGGKVFVVTAGPYGGTGPKLHALDKATGAAVWGPVAIPSANSLAGHAYDKGSVYVVSVEGRLSSYEADTGVGRWSIQLPSQYRYGPPPTAVDGVVYVGGAGTGGPLYAVAAATGGVLWSTSTTNGADSSPTVTGDAVFVAGPCQATRFAKDSGTPLWTVTGSCSGGAGTTAPYAGGLLYTQGMRNPMLFPDGLKLDAANGNQAGDFDIAQSPAIGSEAAFYRYYSSLTAHELGTGRLLWSFGGDLNTSPIVINQVVVVGAVTGAVYAVDATTGARIWTGNAGDPIDAPFSTNIGIGAGEEYLIVPATNRLTAWKIGGP